MTKSKIIYESKEIIYGFYPRSKEWIKYEGVLKIKDSGKTLVSLELTFVPPHPFVCNMPDKHSIKGEDVTVVYAKLVKFFRKFGFEFRN